jgi:NAD(P)-dependent dehydrogenase (short-subunit alcohol dehydrogenase family)
MKLHDRHVVITGAATGIGAALARRFASEGARAVVAADITDPDPRLPAPPPVVQSVRCDVTDPEQIRVLIDTAEAEHGPIDLFCSNAGIIGGIGLHATDEEWRRTLDINVMAHVWAARVLVPRMIERGGGWFLTTASAAGLLTQLGSATYSVSKHGAVAFAEWLSITYGDAGIRVAILCPQAVRTNMTAATNEGGVAGVDGMIEPDAVAEAAVAGLDAEQFLILPHPEVGEYFRRKADDYERWLRGMRRLQERFPAGW